jgi:hypothetical protein
MREHTPVRIEIIGQDSNALFASGHGKRANTCEKSGVCGFEIGMRGISTSECVPKRVT